MGTDHVAESLEKEDSAKPTEELVSTADPTTDSLVDTQLKVSLEELKAEGSKLECKLEIAQLRAENAELRLRELERKYAQLEAEEKDLISGKGNGRGPPNNHNNAGKGTQKGSKGKA